MPSKNKCVALPGLNDPAVSPISVTPSSSHISSNKALKVAPEAGKTFNSGYMSSKSHRSQAVDVMSSTLHTCCLPRCRLFFGLSIMRIAVSVSAACSAEGKTVCLPRRLTISPGRINAVQPVRTITPKGIHRCAFLVSVTKPRSKALQKTA